MSHDRCGWAGAVLQGWIHGTIVADGWAGAVMQLQFRNETEGWTNRLTDRPTQQGVEARVRD